MKRRTHPKHDPRYPQSPHRSSKGSIFIYVLVDSRDWTVRYVGKTKDPKLRISQHIKSTNDSSRDVNWNLRAWIRELDREGLHPLMRIVTQCSHPNWEKVERRWIAYYRRLGMIYNISAGGQVNTSESGALMDVINQSVETSAKIDRFGVLHRSVPKPAKRHGGDEIEKRAMSFLEGKSPRAFFDFDEDRRKIIEEARVKHQKKIETTSPKHQPMLGKNGSMRKWNEIAVKEAFLQKHLQAARNLDLEFQIAIEKDELES